jgi:hypothetical protein
MRRAGTASLCKQAIPKEGQEAAMEVTWMVGAEIVVTEVMGAEMTRVEVVGEEMRHGLGEDCRHFYRYILCVSVV